VASADGLGFVVPIRTLNAGHNPKYFGVGRGVTYYNFSSDQFTGFHGIVIPGTTGGWSPAQAPGRQQTVSSKPEAWVSSEGARRRPPGQDDLARRDLRLALKLNGVPGNDYHPGPC
jgi:TnpA family transposase